MFKVLEEEEEFSKQTQKKWPENQKVNKESFRTHISRRNKIVTCAQGFWEVKNVKTDKQQG